MKITLKVTPNEGEAYEVTTNLFVVVAWDRRTKRQASSLANGIGAEDLAFFAYESAKQSGVVVPAIFDDYIKKIQAVDVVSSDAPNPIDAARTDAQ
jgi:hypothetical protein